MTFCADQHPLAPEILCRQLLGHTGPHCAAETPPWDDCCHIPDTVCEPVAHRPWQPSVSTMQRKILEFVRDHMAEHGFPPSVREVGDHVGLRSTSSVAHQLRELERKGYLRRARGKARAVSVVLPEEVAG